MIRSRRILFERFVARVEDMRLPKCVTFEELVGGTVCVGGKEKEWMRCLLDDLRAFGINTDQWTPAAQDEGGMAQDGGPRGGMVHTEMDRCRERRGWTTTCSRMPERGGKDQGEDIPKQACVRAGWLTIVD